MSAGSLIASFLAGLLSTLSPCVLPLLPLVLGGAVTAHRFGMLALGSGLIAAFVGVGLFVATIGFAIGLDADLFRLISAILLAGLGIVLLSAPLQARLAASAGRIGDAGDSILRRIAPGGWQGQLLIGIVLGMVWSPCVGPTLGAASLLAAQGKNLGSVALTMATFATGAALPLVAVGSLSRTALARWRGKMLKAGQGGKYLLGAGMLAVGLLILTGLDHRLETVLVNASPDWLTDLTTRF
jgi:cytochrome c biogenesis protein CcdA